MSIPPTAVLGHWRFDRWIHDRRAAEELIVSGTLELVPESADRIGWHETGHLELAGTRVPVWRNYAIERRADGWMVTFEDGRDFHPWDPTGEVVHPCADDTYRGAYDLSGLPDRWSMRWDVTGPLKDYSMLTELSTDQWHEGAA